MGLDPTQNPDCEGVFSRLPITVNPKRFAPLAGRVAPGRRDPGRDWSGTQASRGPVEVQMVVMLAVVIGTEHR
jgi:hypothetical protein